MMLIKESPIKTGQSNRENIGHFNFNALVEERLKEKKYVGKFEISIFFFIFFSFFSSCFVTMPGAETAASSGIALHGVDDVQDFVWVSTTTKLLILLL